MRSMAGPPRRALVVVPTHRRSGLLARMVSALEQQTLPVDDFEVIIVDDGSQDDTAATLQELARETKLHLRPMVLETNRGQGVARNRAWRSSPAPLVAFIDDDCVPDPGWLEAGVQVLEDHPTMGVAQGRTLMGPGEISEWTIYREITGPTPWFEACNLFVRREALEAAGGFFEDNQGWGCEDTMLGWGVLAAGWGRGFVHDALVWHDCGVRSVATHVRYGWARGRACMVARRYPDFRRALWRPWAVLPEHAAYCLAVLGGVLAFWKRPFALLVIPYVQMRRPGRDHPQFFQAAAGRFAVDTAVFLGMKAGAIKERLFIL